MPLAEYRGKRDFTTTPEPAGTDGTAGVPARGRRFVVHRHRARRLHYDLRLEVDGVLASWAVPRGPSLDPDVRRMAVHVEDHPMEYLDFEGVIPAAQYGAGDVIVWDWGTWEPEAATPDPAAAIAGGELKFVLHGEKLQGRFVLVRTSDRGTAASQGAAGSGGSGRAAGSAGSAGSGASAGDRPEHASPGTPRQEQWLLLHKRDAHARSGWDAEALPRSVRTGLTNDEVRAGTPAIWVSSAPVAEAQIDLSAAVPAPLPRFVEPMAAALATGVPRDGDWLYEVKWDGFRVQAVVRDDGTVRLLTRRGNDAEEYFPGLLAPPTWIDAREAVVDGEVVALDERGRSDFGLLQERIAACRAGLPSGVVFQAFDLLHLDGRSMLAVPLEERKKLLRLVLRDDPRVRYSGHVVADGAAFLAAAEEHGLEGIVAKRRRSRYESGRRTGAWVKVKVRPEQELVVGGWTPQRDRPDELGAVVVGVHEAGRLRYAGKVGSGFTERGRAALREALVPLRVDGPPFDPAPDQDRRGRWGGDLAGVVWVRPEVVIRAQLGGWTRDGMVRQAAFVGIDPGRDPRDVVREVPVEPGPEAQPAPPPEGSPAQGPGQPLRPGQPTPEELLALGQVAAAGTWHVGGQPVRLTNLDKVLFPAREGSGEPPITKRELVGYFARIAPAMLPHLAGRPLNLHRFPDGIDRPGFWQKNLPTSTPAWLARWHEPGVAGHRSANDHLVADGVAALAWLANQAAFEVHAWTATCADPARPTFALIDIDPGTSTTWGETLTLARLFRTALDHLGVRGYPKTTGSRGIQVWVPVARGRYTFADTSEWVERLSRAVGATVPDLVSWEWAKAGRSGRARLDYTQNAPIKTLVAPYAVRPRPGAPVSMPIRWDELDDPELRSDRWTVRDAVDRVDRVGDLFAGAQSDEQVLPRL